MINMILHPNGKLLPATKLYLFAYLALDGSYEVELVDSQGKHHLGTVQSIQREDGSGSSFNVTMSKYGVTSETIHIRTID